MPVAEPRTKIRFPYLFTPRDYQVNLMGAVPALYSRGVFVHHRRAGKDKSAWNKIICEAIKKKAVYYYFFPTYQQGRKVLWDGIDPRTGLKYLDHIPAEVIKKKNDTELKLELFNGSIVQIVGTDNFNSIMGTPPYGCVFSEYSLQDPRAWDYIRPILRENVGWAIFIYTPRGKNHGWELYRMAQGSPDWFCELLSVEHTKREDGTPVISAEDVEKDHAEGMSEELIQQEYYCSWSGAMEGAYYSKQIELARKEGRISSVPWVTGHEVYTAWDLGFDDSTTIWFFQHINQQIRFVDYYENNGEGLPHYAKVLKEKPYVYGDHYLPHDVEVHDISVAAGNRREILESLGLRSIVTVARARDIQSVMAGIEAGRAILSQCWFDEVKCNHGLMAIEDYHAEYDEERKKLANAPAHTWSSHGSDAFRTFAVGYTPKSKPDKSVSEMMATRRSAYNG